MNGPYSIGVDVQQARPCPYAVLDGDACQVESGWFAGDDDVEAIIADLVRRFPDAVFGIDSPRAPLAKPREWYWRRGGWDRRGASDKGYGRHCEVVIKAHNIANPQWTRFAEDAPDWMRIGFSLFAALDGRAPAHEVFPSASYRLLQHAPEVRATLSFDRFVSGPKDMLDAAIGAVTVHEYAAGRGCGVGDGDGLGEIILPRPLSDPKPGVLDWPART